MKKLRLLVMPLMAVSLLTSCGSKPSEDITHKFTFTGTHCKINGDYIYSHDIFEKDKNVKYTITPDINYSFPTSLSGDAVDYNNETGVITISEIKSDINVTAEAVYHPTGETHHFKFTGTDCVMNGDAIYECDIPIDKPYKCTIVPKTEYLNPSELETVVGENVTYNKDNGVISISAMTSDVEIKATSKPKESTYTFTFVGSDCTIENKELYIVQVEKDKTNVQYEISPKLGFTMPETCAGLPEGVTYSKDGNKGKLIIAKMSQSYQVNISANESPSDITLVVNVKDPASAFSFTINEGGMIDSVNWGDKTIDTSDTHNYASSGTYLIKICFTDVTSFSVKGKSALTEVIYNSNELTTVSDEAFKDCDNLLYFSAPNIISIGEYAFYGCYKLSLVKIQDSANLSEIKKLAFADCSSLDDIKFTEYVTKIGESAFSGTAVSNVTISKCQVLGENAFSKCYRLSNINFPSIPVSNFAFYECYSLKYAEGLSNCTIVNNSSFYNCYNLLTNPSKLQSAGESAFENCLNIKSANFVPIGMSLMNKIGKAAFKNCLNMDYVQLGDSATTVVYDGSNYMFDNCKNSFEIRVPNEKINDYKGALYWSTYASHIVAIIG